MMRRISFDLDDTLICYQDGVPCEPNRVPRVLRFWLREPLRLGAVDLMKELAAHGWRISIFTTSVRPPYMVKWWLWFYGVRLERVINNDVYLRRCGGRSRALRDSMPTKNPALFGIQLHVDDSEHVRWEGEQHGFDVVVIRPDDLNWTQHILKAAGR